MLLSSSQTASVFHWAQSRAPPAAFTKQLRRQSQRHVLCRARESDEARWQQPMRELQSLIASSSQPSPQDALRRVLEVIRGGNLDGMLEFCPDEVIDKLLALRKETGSTEEVHFEDIIKANSDDVLYLDTFALRNLIMTAPQSVQVMSAMHVTPERYLQRCAIVSPSGEECVLTFSTALQEVSECQYRGPPLLSKKWMLQGVTGECNSDELPAHPSPSFPPEAVVEAQLAALREGRVVSVFAHASPENKASTGPIEKFAAMLNSNPLYSPLMGHVAAETVQRLQPSETTYMEVVRVTPAAQGPSAASAAASGNATRKQGHQQQHQRQDRQQQQDGQLIYMWILSRQSESSAWADCWMTDAVRPMSSIPAEFTR